MYFGEPSSFSLRRALSNHDLALLILTISGTTSRPVATVMWEVLPDVPLK